MSHHLHEVYRRLYANLARNIGGLARPLEVMVGAVLTQNTAWKNVERAIAHLHDAGMLSVQRLHAQPTDKLADLIRPAGYFRLKARRLYNLIDLIVTEYQGSLDAMFSVGRHRLREQLLSVNGIGPETADSILLYAARMPTFVVDTYTARVLQRHGWIGLDADYSEIKDLFESSLEEDVQMFNEYHALLVCVGKDFCRKTPKCQSCPLFDLLPEGGPLGVDA